MRFFQYKARKDCHLLRATAIEAFEVLLIVHRHATEIAIPAEVTLRTYPRSQSCLCGQSRYIFAEASQLYNTAGHHVYPKIRRYSARPVHSYQNIMTHRSWVKREVADCCKGSLVTPNWATGYRTLTPSPFLARRKAPQAQPRMPKQEIH